MEYNQYSSYKITDADSDSDTDILKCWVTSEHEGFPYGHYNTL